MGSKPVCVAETPKSPEKCLEHIFSGYWRTVLICVLFHGRSKHPWSLSACMPRTHGAPIGTQHLPEDWKPRAEASVPALPGLDLGSPGRVETAEVRVRQAGWAPA